MSSAVASCPDAALGLLYLFMNHSTEGFLQYCFSLASLLIDMGFYSSCAEGQGSLMGLSAARCPLCSDPAGSDAGTPLRRQCLPGFVSTGGIGAKGSKGQSDISGGTLGKQGEPLLHVGNGAVGLNFTDSKTHGQTRDGMEGRDSKGCMCSAARQECGSASRPYTPTPGLSPMSPKGTRKGTGMNLL